MVLEMSKTYQYRKIMKPLLERKRRARINKCLDHLKELMVECLTRDGEHVTRLEKADILELTVDHMRKLKQNGTLTKTSSSSSSSQMGSFCSGYSHAADQIIQALHQQLRNDELYNQIVEFLSKRFQEISGITSSSHTKPSLEEYSPTFYDNFTNEYCIEHNNSTTTKAAYELPRNYKSMWRPW